VRDEGKIKRAVVVGGGLIGMETADYLSEQGSQVTLVEMLKRSPVLKITSHGYMLHTRLRDKNCRLFFNTSLKSIGEGSVEIESEGNPSPLSPIDQVVLAVGLKPKDELKAALEALKIPYTVVGDAKRPRRIFEAVEEGTRAAWELVTPEQQDFFLTMELGCRPILEGGVPISTLLRSSIK